MTGNLPPPVTVTDVYLAAVYERLGELLDRLSVRPVKQPPGGAVELREPEQSATTARRPAQRRQSAKKE